MILMLSVSLYAAATGQETGQPNNISETADLDQKVLAGRKWTYLELIRLVFPKIKRLYSISSPDFPPSRLPFRYGIDSAAPRPRLTGKAASSLRRRNYLFDIESVKALALDEKRRRVALIIHAATSYKNKPGFDTLAVFALAPKPKLLAAFDAGDGEKLDFGREQNFFEEERQFWIAVEKTARNSGIREKRLFLLELINGVPRVVIDDLPAPQIGKTCGTEYSYDAHYVSQMMCGQEIFAGGRKVYVLYFSEDWQPNGEKCNASSSATATIAHKREREYNFRWNKRLGRYEKSVFIDDTLENEAGPRDYQIETDFAGFIQPRVLSGDAVFMTRVYDLTLYGGGENWQWSGNFRQPPGSRSSMTFGFYKELSDLAPQKYGKRKYRVDIRFIVTGIRLGQDDDGSWSNQYECLVIGAKERL